MIQNNQFGFQIPIYGKKKEEEQYQSKLPMQSVVHPVSKQPTQTKVEPLRKPMMTYDIQGTILSGVSDETAVNLQNYAKANAKTPEEAKLLLQDLHQSAVKGSQVKKYIEDRQKNKAEMIKMSMSAKDPEEKKQIDLSLKLSNISDIIREGAVKEGYVDVWDIDDKSVIDKFVSANPGQEVIITDYLNGKISNVDVGKKLGLIPEVVKEAEEDKPMSETAKDVSIGVGATVGGLVGAYGLGLGLEGIGKTVYGLTLPPGTQEAESILKEKAGLGPKVRKTVDTAIEKNVVGTRTGIGVKSLKEADKIFKDTVNPMLEKSVTKTNVQSLIDDLSSEIPNIAKGDPDKLAELNEAINEMKKSFGDKKYSELTQKELHELKSGLQGRAPQKYFKGKEITNAYQELRAKLSTKLTNTLHKNLATEFGEDTAKIYKDYANLKGLSKVGVKSITQSGLKGGFGGFWSTIVEELGTPISTIGGKVTYEAGKLLKKLPETLLKIAKKSPGAIKTLLKSSPAGLIAPDLEDVAKKGTYTFRKRIISDAENKKGMFKGMSDEQIEKILPKKDRDEYLSNNKL